MSVRVTKRTPGSDSLTAAGERVADKVEAVVQHARDVLVRRVLQPTRSVHSHDEVGRRSKLDDVRKESMKGHKPSMFCGDTARVMIKRANG